MLQVIRSSSGTSAEDLIEALSEKFDFTSDVLLLHLLALESDDLVINHDGMWGATEPQEVPSDELPTETDDTDEDPATQPAY